MAGCSAKAFIWTYWGLNTFISIIYIGLALNAFQIVRTATDKYAGDPTIDTPVRNTVLGACFLGFLTDVFFIIYSFLILFLRLFGDIKLWYGLMLGGCLSTAWFHLLVGIVLNAWTTKLGEEFRDNGLWSNTQYQSFQATYVFNYIQIFTYLIAFFVFLWGRKHLGRAELSTGSDAPLSGAPASNYVDMGSVGIGNGNKGSSV